MTASNRLRIARSDTPPPSAVSDYVIQTEGLDLCYGRKKALNQLTLRIPRGRIHAIVGHFHVLPEQRIADISRGERAGVNLAMALAQDPELLILDEPTMGLDVVAKRAFLEAVLRSVDEVDTTIIYCSHQMD